MDDDFINQFVLWKGVKIVSLVAYVLILLAFPFSSFWATIILFALIAFWSRVPAMISMFTKEVEVLDFFTVLLAIHVGGIFAGLFGAAIMLFSKLFAPNEWYLYTIKDAASFFVCALITPLVYAASGSTLTTIYVFMIVRFSVYMVLTVILEPEYIMLELGLCTAGILVGGIYNTFIMKSFEGLVAPMIEEGVKFSFSLFLVATLVVGGFYLLSKAAKWLEARRMKRVEAGLEDEYKPPIWEMDAESRGTPVFVRTI